MKIKMVSPVRRLLLAVLVTGLLPTFSTFARPATADDTVRQALRTISENRPERLLELMPNAYQQDLDALFSGFAARMDAELWNAGRGLLGQIATLGTDKRDLLVQFTAQQNPEADLAETAASIDSAVAVLKLLSEGRMLEIERMRQAGLREWLVADGRELFGKVEALAETGLPAATPNPWRLALEGVALVDSDGNRATVRVDPEEAPLEMVRVDGAWIPADMAQGWDEWRNEAMKSVAEMDFASPEGQRKKAQTLMVINMIQGVVTQLQQAETVEQLQSSAMGLMMMLGGGMMMQAP